MTFLEHKFIWVVCLSFHLTSDGTKYLLQDTFREAVVSLISFSFLIPNFESILSKHVSFGSLSNYEFIQ